MNIPGSMSFGSPKKKFNFDLNGLFDFFPWKFETKFKITFKFNILKFCYNFVACIVSFSISFNQFRRFRCHLH